MGRARQITYASLKVGARLAAVALKCVALLWCFAIIFGMGLTLLKEAASLGWSEAWWKMVERLGIWNPIVFIVNVIVLSPALAALWAAEKLKAYATPAKPETPWFFR